MVAIVKNVAISSTLRCEAMRCRDPTLFLRCCSCCCCFLFYANCEAGWLYNSKTVAMQIWMRRAISRPAIGKRTIARVLARERRRVKTEKSSRLSDIRAAAGPTNQSFSISPTTSHLLGWLVRSPPFNHPKHWW